MPMADIANYVIGVVVCVNWILEVNVEDMRLCIINYTVLVS